MKKFLTALLAIILFLSSCGLDYYEIDTVDSKSPLSHIDGDITYIANTSSRSYHLPSCYVVKNLKEENKWETADLNYLLEREFKPCKICIEN